MLPDEFYKVKGIGNPKFSPIKKKLFPSAYSACINLSKNQCGLPTHAIKFLDSKVERFPYYQALVDSNCSNVFWIKVLSSYEDGARSFSLTNRNLAVFELEELLDYLGVKEEKFHCLAVWDESLCAMKIDLNRRINTKKRIFWENNRKDV